MDITRRTALAAGLTGAGSLALAACGSSGSGGATDTTKAEPPADGGTASAPATGTSSTATSDPASSGGGASGSALAKLDSITVGQAVSASLDGKPVLVARPTETTAACFSAICTHQGCTVAPAGSQLHCPCHGSVFDAKTGEVVSGPAPRALDKVGVSVENGEVVATG